MKLDRLYILTGLTWMVAGMIFGIWVGITDQTNYANSHAHMNLLGFVASLLFGLLHWAYPTLAKSRLALAQFIAYQAGIAMLILGKFLVDGGTQTLFLEVGSMVTVLGAAAMLLMFARHGTKSA